MAPITDEIIDKLNDTIHKLESRVKELEAKLNGSSSGGGANPLNSMRMVLMGPPGAGMSYRVERTGTGFLLTLVQVRERKHRGSRTSTASAIWYDELFVLPTQFADPDAGHWRYAASASRAKDRPRTRGQEDHGSGRPGQRRYYGQHDQERVDEQQRVRKRVRDIPDV